MTPLREALMRAREDHDHESILESLSDDGFTRLERDLRGVWLNREESLYVKPDIDYFVKLASTRGDEADKEFFAALKMTYQDSHEPAYLEFVTDLTACTLFGNMDLVKLYGVWSAFRSRYPDRYKDGTQAEWDRVHFELTETVRAMMRRRSNGSWASSFEPFQRLPIGRRSNDAYTLCKLAGRIFGSNAARIRAVALAGWARLH